MFCFYCRVRRVGCFLQVYDRDGNQLAHFVKGDPYLKVLVRCMGACTTPMKRSLITALKYDRRVCHDKRVYSVPLGRASTHTRVPLLPVVVFDSVVGNDASSRSLFESEHGEHQGPRDAGDRGRLAPDEA